MNTLPDECIINIFCHLDQPISYNQWLGYDTLCKRWHTLAKHIQIYLQSIMKSKELETWSESNHLRAYNLNVTELRCGIKTIDILRMTDMIIPKDRSVLDKIHTFVYYSDDLYPCMKNVTKLTTIYHDERSFSLNQCFPKLREIIFNNTTLLGINESKVYDKITLNYCAWSPKHLSCELLIINQNIFNQDDVLIKKITTISCRRCIFTGYYNKKIAVTAYIESKDILPLSSIASEAKIEYFEQDYSIGRFADAGGAGGYSYHKDSYGIWHEM